MLFLKILPIQFPFYEGMIHIYFVQCFHRWFIQKEFFCDAFMFLLSGMFKDSHFADEKTPVQVSSDLYTEAHCYSSLLLAISLEIVTKYQWAQVFI